MRCLVGIYCTQANEPKVRSAKCEVEGQSVKSKPAAQPPFDFDSLRLRGPCAAAQPATTCTRAVSLGPDLLPLALRL